MGLIKWLRRRKGGLQAIVYWDGLPETVGTIRIPPLFEYIIYDYDTKCLKGLKPGDRFICTAVPAAVVMKSHSTGFIASNSTFDDVAYAYKGKVFGLCSAYADEIRDLMHRGYIVEVEALVTGIDKEFGYKKVVGYFGTPPL